MNKQIETGSRCSLFNSGNNNTVRYTKYDSHDQLWKTTISHPLYLFISSSFSEVLLCREVQLCALYVSFCLLDKELTSHCLRKTLKVD